MLCITIVSWGIGGEIFVDLLDQQQGCSNMGLNKYIYYHIYFPVFFDISGFNCALIYIMIAITVC